MRITCIKPIITSVSVVAITLIFGVSINGQESHFASGWTVNKNADWTPFPPNGQVLGPGVNDCTGGTNPAEGWAEFTFPAFMTPGTITGIKLCVKYLSASGTNEAQLRFGGAAVGSKTLPVQGGQSFCSNTVVNCVGGPGDLWGSGLTSPAGVSVRINQDANTIEIDNVELTFYFSGSNQDPDCSGADIADQVANASCEAIISGADVTDVTDPDMDPLTISVNPTTLSLGANVVTVTADDGNGGSCNIDINVTVVDNTDPIPDVANLPDATGECNVSLSPPTATDNCAGSVLGTTGDPLNYNSQGSFMVTWTYDDGNGNNVNQIQNVLVDDVTPPVPDVANLPDATGECSVTVTAPSATDNCEGAIVGMTSDPLNYTDQGTFMITWTYDDGNGNSVNQIQNVLVDDVTPPVPDVANLPDATGECSVTVSAPSATDNCEGAIIGTTTDPTTYTEQGTFTVTWTYDDGNGNTTDQTQQVIVDDVTPPVITTSGNVIELWPPNHKYSTIDIADCVIAVSDNCNLDLEIGDVTIAQVSSDEPEDVKGKGGGGDGNTMDDIVISDDCSAVDLRRERQGNNGNGRVYTIHFALDDGNGNTGTASCQVSVPKSQNGTPAVDDGAAAGYTEHCTASFGKPHDNKISQQKLLTIADIVLEQNHPNPFSNFTVFSIITPESSMTTLSIFNMRGQKVSTIVEDYLDAGHHLLQWDGTNGKGAKLENGIYVYQLQVGNVIMNKKLIIIN